MAGHLSRVFGTEEDRVNCPFFYKMGACRHGDRCSRLHHKPQFSPTVLFPHMYYNPRVVLAATQGRRGYPAAGPAPGQPHLDMRKIQRDFEDFYEEVFDELSQFGEVEAFHVCDNLGDHMVGNVYVKFAEEESAAKALQRMNGRFYDGRMITAEFSPVSDFREARCRQFDEGNCKRGDQCNFMHLMYVPSSLRRDLFDNQPHRSRKSRRRRDDDRDDRRRDDRRRDDRHRDDRHRSSRRRDDRDRDRDGDRDGDRRRHRDRSRDRRSSREDRDRDGDERKDGGGDDKKARSPSRSRSRDRRRRSKSRSRSPHRRDRSRDRSRDRGRSAEKRGDGEDAGTGAGAGADAGASAKGDAERSAE